MSTITLLNLRTRARDRANMENSTFVSDSIFNTYINYAASHLRDIMASKVGEDYFATSVSHVLTSGQETVTLPTDFHKLLWVEELVDGDQYVKMHRFEVSEQPAASSSLIRPWQNLKYRLRANNLWLAPASASGGKNIRIWYVPVSTALSLDGDTLEGFNGWDEFIVLIAARKAMVKEEQDVTEIDREVMVFMERLETMVPNRDQAQPMRVQDTQRAWGYCDGLE
jgi:hypothetical protein